jgi:hypothetical protein
MFVEILGRDQLQDGVAEILEALVVARRDSRILIGERAVGDGLEEEPRVAKVNPDLLLEELQRLSERDAPRVLRLCYEPAFSWMYSQA